MKKRCDIIIITILLILLGVSIWYIHMQRLGAYEWIERGWKRYAKNLDPQFAPVKCLFEVGRKDEAFDLTLVFYVDKQDRVYAMILQKKCLGYDEYAGGSVDSLISKDFIPEDSIQEMKDASFLGSTFPRTPESTRYLGDGVFLWGVLYNENIIDVEIWGSKATIVSLPDYPTRICYFLHEYDAASEKTNDFNYGENGIHLIYR